MFTQRSRGIDSMPTVWETGSTVTTIMLWVRYSPGANFRSVSLPSSRKLTRSLRCNDGSTNGVLVACGLEPLAGGATGGAPALLTDAATPGAGVAAVPLLLAVRRGTVWPVIATNGLIVA